MSKECKCGCIEELTSFPDCMKDKSKIKLRLEKERFRLNNWTRQQDYKWRTYSYLKHRQRICEAKSMVDSKCPKCPPSLFTRNNTLYNRRIANFARIERENVRLTQNIQKAFIEDSQVDNHLSPDVTCRENRGFSRLCNQMKIAHHNLIIADRLTKIKGTPEYLRCDLLNWYRTQENYMEHGSEFPLFWRDVLCKSYEAAALAKAMEGQKPQVYFDLEVKGQEVGRVIIELDTMAAPVAVESFRVMFSGKFKNHKYKCTKLYKVWPDMGWAFGRGAKTIFKCPFPPKKYRMKHDREGVVTLMNNGSDMFEAEFLITSREMKPLDNRNLAIGYVTEGMEFLNSLSQYMFREGQVFRFPMFIIKTGEYDPENPPPPSKLAHKCVKKGEEDEEEVESAKNSFDFQDFDEDEESV